MKLKKPRRPQTMFLFDPDFRYRQMDDIPPPSTTPPPASFNMQYQVQGIISYKIIMKITWQF